MTYTIERREVWIAHPRIVDEAGVPSRDFGHWKSKWVVHGNGRDLAEIFERDGLWHVMGHQGVYLTREHAAEAVANNTELETMTPEEF